MRKSVGFLFIFVVLLVSIVYGQNIDEYEKEVLSEISSYNGYVNSVDDDTYNTNEFQGAMDQGSNQIEIIRAHLDSMKNDPTIDYSTDIEALLDDLEQTKQKMQQMNTNTKSSATKSPDTSLPPSQLEVPEKKAQGIEEEQKELGKKIEDLQSELKDKSEEIEDAKKEVEQAKKKAEKAEQKEKANQEKVAAEAQKKLEKKEKEEADLLREKEAAERKELNNELSLNLINKAIKLKESVNEGDPNAAQVYDEAIKLLDQAEKYRTGVYDKEIASLKNTYEEQTKEYNNLYEANSQASMDAFYDLEGDALETRKKELEKVTNQLEGYNDKLLGASIIMNEAETELLKGNLDEYQRLKKEAEQLLSEAEKEGEEVKKSYKEVNPSAFDKAGNFISSIAKSTTLRAVTNKVHSVYHGPGGRGSGLFADLLTDDDEVNAKKEEWDRTFSEFLGVGLGTDYWTDYMCRQKIDSKGGNTAFVIQGDILDTVAHIEGERTDLSSYNKTTNETSGYFFYKISFVVNNPAGVRDQDDTGDDKDLVFNVAMIGPGGERNLFAEDIVLEDEDYFARTNEDMIFAESANQYDEVCIVFNRDIRYLQGGEYQGTNRICNSLV